MILSGVLIHCDDLTFATTILGMEAVIIRAPREGGRFRFLSELAKPKSFSILFAVIVSFCYFMASVSYAATTESVAGVSPISATVFMASIAYAFVAVVASNLVFRMSDWVLDGHARKAYIPPRVFVAIILFAWLPWALVRFPGNYDPDTIWELLQTYGYFPLSDQHPWFDTLIFASFWRLGDVLGSHVISLLIYTMIQMLATAVVFGCALSYFSQFCPRWMIIFALIFYSLHPFVPMVAQAMMKDSLFACAFTIFVLLFFELMRTRGSALEDRTFTAGFITACLLACLTKKTGFYIVILSLLVCIPLIGKDFRRKCVVVTIVMTILFAVLWESIVLPAVGVRKGSGGEAFSVPFQQVGLLVKSHGSEIKEDDLLILRGVFVSPETIASDYTPLKADAVKSHWNDEASAGNKIRFLRWYTRELTLHPVTYAKAFFALNYPLFVADTSYNHQDVESGLFFIDFKYNKDVSKVLASWSPSASESDISSELDTAVPKFETVSKRCDEIYLAVVHSLPFLFCKSLFGFWIPMLALICCFRQKRPWKCVSLVPIVLTTLALMLGPVILPRYMTSSVYLAPIALLVVFSMCAEKSTKLHDNNKILHRLA